MKSIFIKIENYRNIPAGNPIEIEIKEGVNFILGPNNQGKSNLLRFLHEMKPVLRSITSNSRGIDTQIALESFFDQIVNQRSDSRSVKFEIRVGKYILQVTMDPYGGDPHTKNCQVSAVLKGGNENPTSCLKELESLTDTLYVGAWRSGLSETSGKHYDIEIGTRFISNWSKWASGDNVEQRNKIDLLVEELKNLFGFDKFDIIPNDDKTNLLVKTDDGSFTLDELGGGISHFIVVLGNVLIKNPGYILIDEPELGLHPKMQEVFVRALAAKSKYGIMATSHSIGLARSTADTILSLTKSSVDKLKLEPFGRLYTPTTSQSINELGYSQFVETGSNNILLVEGRTDIKAFREILRKFNIDTSFIILSFGGAQFFNKDKKKINDELKELKKLNAKSISVIFDGSKLKSTDSLEPRLSTFRQCCRSLGFAVFPTEVHSTENYITQEAIDKILGPPYTSLTPFQNFNKVTQIKKWDKNKNWLLFREMKLEDFDNTKLKKFIEDKLAPHS